MPYICVTITSKTDNNMFNYSFKIKNHYQLSIDEHEITVTKETVKDDAVIYGKDWNAFYYNTDLGTEIKGFGFKTKKEAEQFLIGELNKQ